MTLIYTKVNGVMREGWVMGIRITVIPMLQGHILWSTAYIVEPRVLAILDGR